MTLPAFQGNLMLPSSRHSSTLKMEVVGCSEETLVTFYQTTKCHITEGSEKKGKDLNIVLRKI
jgi:hypothetical protein